MKQMSKDPFLGRLRVLDICDLSDALDALSMTPAVTGLVLTSGARPIAGRAITVRIGAGPSPPGVTRHLSTAAVEAGGPDNVIVVEQRTGLDAAGWGGILSRAAQHRGVAGSIVDGLTRDVEEANKLGSTHRAGVGARRGDPRQERSDVGGGRSRRTGLQGHGRELRDHAGAQRAIAEALRPAA
jgi:regulator of RNase E activity RraA